MEKHKQLNEITRIEIEQQVRARIESTKVDANEMSFDFYYFYSRDAQLVACVIDHSAATD